MGGWIMHPQTVLGGSENTLANSRSCVSKNIRDLDCFKIAEGYMIGYCGQMICCLPGSSPSHHFERREEPGDEVGRQTERYKLIVFSIITHYFYFKSFIRTIIIDKVQNLRLDSAVIQLQIYRTLQKCENNISFCCQQYANKVTLCTCPGVCDLPTDAEVVIHEFGAKNRLLAFKFLWVLPRFRFCIYICNQHVPN